MSTEIELASETTRDDLQTRPRHEVEAAAQHWFDTAKSMKVVQDQLVEDLEDALNACKAYQGQLAMLSANDPQIVAVRNLLTKYRMGHTTPARVFKVYVDGIEITNHPDSIEGTEVEVLELTGEEYYGTTTVELVQDEHGEMHFLSRGEEVAPDVDAYADEPEPEPITPETRNWLKQENDPYEDDHIDPYNDSRVVKAGLKRIAEGLANWVQR